MARPKNKRRIVLALVAAAVAVAVGAWLTWNKPHRKAEDMAGVQTDAPALYTAFSQKAGQAYDGKVLEVTGTVADASANQDGKAVVGLETADPMGVVQCTFREAGALPKQGDRIAVKGFCNGYTEMDGLGGTVVLNDCIRIR